MVDDNQHAGVGTLAQTLHWTSVALIRRWWLIVAAAAAAGALAFIYVSSSPRQWTGEALLQIGRLPAVPGELASGVLNPAGGPIQAPSDVATLAQSMSFKANVMQALGPANDPAIPSNLDARVTSGSEFVNISFRSTSPEQVKSVLEAAAKLIVDRHQELARARTSAIERTLEWVNTELDQQDELSKRALSEPSGAASRSDLSAILAGAAREQFAGQVMRRQWELRKMKASGEAVLASAPYRTELVGPIFVRQLPRGGATAVVLAITGGTLFAVVFILLGAGDPGRLYGAKASSGQPSSPA